MAEFIDKYWLVIAWFVAIILVLIFNYCCSKVSNGEHKPKPFTYKTWRDEDDTI